MQAIKDFHMGEGTRVLYWEISMTAYFHLHSAADTE